MKPNNILLVIIGVVLAALAFMFSDVVSRRQDSGAVQPAELREAIAAGKPVLLEFYADWCPPCRTVGPVVEEFAREVQGKASVVRINVDEQGALAREYRVQGIPAFIAVKQGRETARQVGVIDKSVMRQMLGI